MIQGAEFDGNVTFDIAYGPTITPEANSSGYQFLWRGLTGQTNASGTSFCLVDPGTGNVMFSADSVVAAPEIGVQLLTGQTSTANLPGNDIIPSLLSYGDAVVASTVQTAQSPGTGVCLSSPYHIAYGFPVIFAGPQVDATAENVVISDGQTWSLTFTETTQAVIGGATPGTAGPVASLTLQMPFQTLSIGSPPRLPRNGYRLSLMFWTDVTTLVLRPQSGSNHIVFNPPASATQGQGFEFVFMNFGGGPTPCGVWSRRGGPAVGSGGPYLLPFVSPGGLGFTPAQVWTAIAGFSLPINLTGSVASCDIAPTNNISIVIRKNSSNIGTINFLAGATAGTFTFAGGVSFASGDLLKVMLAPADATFASLSVVFLGTKA